MLKQHTSESSLNWHGLTWIGGTFESDTGGTFHSDMPGTFQSAADGTFVSAIDGTFQSDMSGTFGPMLSPDSPYNYDMSRELAVHNPLRSGFSGVSLRHISAVVSQPYTRL